VPNSELNSFQADLATQPTTSAGHLGLNHRLLTLHSYTQVN